MRFRDANPESMVRLGLFVCALALFSICAALAYAQRVIPAALAFFLAGMLAGFAQFFEHKDRPALTPQWTLWEQRNAEAAKLLGLLHTLAISVAGQLIGICIASKSTGDGSRRHLFNLVKLLDSLLAQAGMDFDERQRVKSQWHRHTAVEMLMPLTVRINELIDEKYRAHALLVEEGIKSAGETADRGRLAAIEAQMVSFDRISMLSSTLEMFRALTRAISDADCLSLAERSRLCADLAEDLSDLKEWVTHQRLRRPELWFQSMPESTK